MASSWFIYITLPACNVSEYITAKKAWPQTISNRTLRKRKYTTIIQFESPPPRALTAPSGPRPPHYPWFTITLRHTTLGRTPLEEWSAECRDLYMTTQNTHNRQTSKPPTGFEPTMPVSQRPQIHALDRAATGIGSNRKTGHKSVGTFIA